MALKTIVAHLLAEAYPAGNYMFKVNNRNTGTRCGISSKLKIKTPKRLKTLSNI